MRKMLFSLLILLSTGNALFGEVEEIQIKWNSFKCLSPCVDSIAQHLKGINTISDLQINGQGGTAVMKWSQNIPFSYEPFRGAFAAAGGIKIREMRVRVRGKISHDSSNYYLNSTGDQSSFQLIGPIYTEPGRYAPKNIASHPLTSEMKDQLSEAENHNATVVISGPLYLPSHYPRVLLAEDIKVEKK